MSTKLPSTELKYWLAFNQIQIIGPIRIQKLLNHFKTLQRAWNASRPELLKAGLEEKTARELAELKLKINPDSELEKLEQNKIGVITIQDENYPGRLKEIYAPPPVLYYQGVMPGDYQPTLAVVGSRKISDYGKQATKQIVSELAKRGIIIISGLALGIDAWAHQTALANQGVTLAVLGCGLNQIYPANNRRLAQEIIAGAGAVISEFPPAMPPLKHNFPIRNRIISGLGLGTLIVEAAEKSGALITASYTLEQNREVFAVPGNIFHPNNVGTNHLLKLGAHLVTSANDILEVLALDQINAKKVTNSASPENATQQILFDLLKQQPLHVDKIAQSARLDISVVNTTLSIMEIKGLIKHLGSNVYTKA